VAENDAKVISPLARKLAHFAPLTEQDFLALDQIPQSEEHIRARQDIVAEGQVPRSVLVLKTGMAYRYRVLRDGRRQIMTFLLPGDLCDLDVFLLKQMDHSVGAVLPVRLSAISRDDVLNMTIQHPRISAGLWWSTMQEEAMLRERIVALGRRDAVGRLAYLLCELVWRQQAIGHGQGATIPLPLTQAELADALGLTPVHINRVLQDLRQRKLLTLQQRTLVLLDIDKMAEIAGFNRNYLHFGGAPEDVERFFEQREQPQQGP
jgi:CRP-like cAMP-binding protein